MANDKSVASSVDVLSSVERRLVVDALSLKLASVKRAARAASNPVVSEALNAEAASVEALIVKFR